MITLSMTNTTKRNPKTSKKTGTVRAGAIQESSSIAECGGRDIDADLVINMYVKV